VKGVQDALTRLSGVKKVTVKLQEGLVVVETDPTEPVLPSLFWKEILRVGFLPERMAIWATGTFDAHSFALDGVRWPLLNKGAAEAGRRRAHFKVAEGGEDPPQVEFVD
jgi:hypothetical protein